MKVNSLEPSGFDTLEIILGCNIVCRNDVKFFFSPFLVSFKRLRLVTIEDY